MPSEEPKPKRPQTKRFKTQVRTATLPILEILDHAREALARLKRRTALDTGPKPSKGRGPGSRRLRRP
jgi:hypothetical protein